MYITEHERAADPQWVEVAEAVETARLAYATDQEAREFLIRRAGLDRILTRCRAMRCETRAARVNVSERDNCLISPEFWEQYGRHARRTLQDWITGDFERTMQAAMGARDIVLVTGVQFSKRDMIAELPKPPLEWIPASRAFDILKHANVSDVAGAICGRALECLVRAKAKKFTWEVDSEGRNENFDCDVPAEFWWAKGGAALQCNWDTGDFSTWMERTYEWKAFGVQFAVADIEAMLPKPMERSTASEPEQAVILMPTADAATPRGRNLTHDHPFAAAMAALKLSKIPVGERDRLTGPSVGKTMEEYYRASGKGGRVPHSDNLDEYGASVLKALNQVWNGAM